MSPHFEQLPIELLLNILSYLEAHDLINAFGNINSYFRSLFSSPYLRVHVELQKHDVEYTSSTTSIWSILALECIHSLTSQLLDSEKVIDFLRPNISRLNQLSFLKLAIKSKDAKNIQPILVSLVALKGLSICESQENLHESDKSNLFSIIFYMPKLKSCIWNGFSSKSLSTETDEEDQPVNHSLIQLCIKIDVTTTFVLFILRHLSRLRILRLQYLSWPEGISSTSISFPSTIIVLIIGTANTSFANLQRIIQVCPSLRCFHIMDWHIRDRTDEHSLFDGRLKRLFDSIICFHVETVIERRDGKEQEEIEERITTCSWLILNNKSYDYMDACFYFNVIMKKSVSGVCYQQHSNDKIHPDFSLRKLGFRFDHQI